MNETLNNTEVVEEVTNEAIEVAEKAAIDWKSIGVIGGIGTGVVLLSYGVTKAVKAIRAKKSNEPKEEKPVKEHFWAKWFKKNNKDDNVVDADFKVSEDK